MCDRSWQGTRQQPGAGSRTPSEGAEESIQSFFNKNADFCPKYHFILRVERDEYRRPKTYAVRVKFSLFLICWVEREKLLFSLFKSGFDDAMNMENDNINNSL